MTSMSPLKAAAASGVWPRSFASSASAPCSSSSFTTFGMAVIGGDHQQAVALLVAQVRRQSPDEILAEFLGLPSPDQLEDLLEKCQRFLVDLRLLVLHGDSPGPPAMTRTNQMELRQHRCQRPKRALQRAAARRASSSFNCGSGVSSTPWDFTERRDGGTGLRPHQPVRRSGIVAGGLQQRLRLPHLATGQIAGEVGCSGLGRQRSVRRRCGRRSGCRHSGRFRRGCRGYRSGRLDDARVVQRRHVEQAEQRGGEQADHKGRCGGDTRHPVSHARKMKAGKSDCHMHTRAAGDVEVV